MTLVNPETGELIDALNKPEAERLTMRISLKLDTLADAYEGVMPLIREAITRRAHDALGYRSLGEYVSDRFGGSLQRLGVDTRREVVRELTAAGMSTRAIAPVVGVGPTQVRKDQQQVRTSAHLSQTPEPAEEGEADAGSGQTPEGERSDRDDPMPAATRPPVTGIDGKTYSRPAPVNHAARADEAVADFPDLAYYRDEAVDLEHCWRLADTLRTFSEPELSSRLETLRRSIAADRAKRNGTYVSPLPQARTCPTCGQTVKD